MAKMPAMQFYVGDWMKDPNLRRCTHAAKGVWIDMLCLMWESEERGVLATSQRAWSDEEIALAVGGDSATTLACLTELTLKGVANRRDNGAIFSRRMVRDEHKRTLCKEAGKRGGNPILNDPNYHTLKGRSKGSAKGRSKGEITPSSSSSSSSSERERESHLALEKLKQGQFLPDKWRNEATEAALIEYCEWFARNDRDGRPMDQVTLRERLVKCGDWTAERLRKSLNLTMSMMRTDKIFDDEQKPPKRGGDRKEAKPRNTLTPVE